MTIGRALVLDIAINTARIQKDVRKAEKSFNSLRKNIKKVGLAIVKITAAVIALRAAYELANSAAKFDQAQQAFANLAASYEGNAQSIIESLRAASGETISTADLMTSAGTAMLLGIPIDKLVGMMEIARSASRITGQTIQAAFNDISKGMGRQSKLILDNLGIMVSAGEANKVYAKTLGKTASQLTDAEKKQAFFNATLKAGEDIVKRVKVENLTAAESMQRFSAIVDDTKILLGKLIITISTGVVGAFNFFAGAVYNVIQAIIRAIRVFVQLQEKIPFLGKQFKEVSKTLLEYEDRLKGIMEISFKTAQSQFAIATGIWEEKKAAEGMIETRAKLLEQRNKEIEANDKLAQQQQDKDALDKARKEAESLEKQLAEEGGGPIEQMITQHQDQIDLLEAYRARRLEIIRLTSQSESEIAIRQANLEIELAKKKRDINMRTTMQQVGFTLNTMNQLFAASGKQNKKLHKLNKAYAISQAIISTYQGATKALAQGGFVGIFMAAVVIAAGLASIAKIKSSEPGGGGGGSISLGGGGGGGSVPSLGTISEQPLPQQDRVQPSQNVTINIQNGTGDKAYWQELVDDVIVPGINDASERNINLTIKTADV